MRMLVGAKYVSGFLFACCILAV